MDLRPYATPSATTFAMVEREMLSAWRGLTLDRWRYYGDGEAVWKDDAEYLIDTACRQLSWQFPDTTRALDIAKRLVGPQKGQTEDPLLAWAAFTVSGSLPWQQRNAFCNKAMNMFRREAKEHADWQRYPDLLRVQLHGYCLGTHDRPDNPKELSAAIEVVQELGDVMDRCARAGDGLIAPRFVLEIFSGIDLRDPRLNAVLLKRMEQALDKSSYPRWMQAAILGDLHVDFAWSYRGGGYANTVSQDGWKGFGQHLNLSAAYFEEAWELHPYESWVATVALTPARNSDHSRVSAETWMHRSMATCLDEPLLRSHINNFFRPRWGGSYENLASIGCDFVDTGRFDSQAPWRIFNFCSVIIQDAGDTKDWSSARAALADPRTQASLTACVEGYRLHRGGARNPSHWNQWIVIQHHAGLADDVRRKLLELDQKDWDLPAFQRAGLDPWAVTGQPRPPGAPQLGEKPKTQKR
jgi:hypothetical protein